MDFRLDYIFRRRSVRTFTEEPVTREDIEALLQAAMAAPSSGNRKPWHFLVCTHREVLNRIAEIHPNGKMLAHAPLGILAAADVELSQSGWVQDCSAALTNILLAAPALGLGGVWLGIWPREERVQAIAQVLDLPENLTPMGMAALGHPQEVPPPRTQYNPARIIWRE